jgi:hypothetical protein
VNDVNHSPHTLPSAMSVVAGAGGGYGQGGESHRTQCDGGQVLAEVASEAVCYVVALYSPFPVH